MHTSLTELQALHRCLLKPGSMWARSICKNFKLNFYANLLCSSVQSALAYVRSSDRFTDPPAGTAVCQQMPDCYCFLRSAHVGKACLQKFELQFPSKSPLLKCENLISSYLKECSNALTQQKTRFVQKPPNGSSVCTRRGAAWHAA